MSESLGEAGRQAILADLLRLLMDLGSTSALIEVRLIQENQTGRRNNATDNPVARYLTRRLSPLRVGVNAVSVHVYNQHDVLLVEVPSPPSIAQFIQQFNRGAFYDLEEAADHHSGSG